VVPGTGIAASISSNRTSYIFGTKGPSLTPLGASGEGAVGRGTFLSHEFMIFTRKAGFIVGMFY